jgi:FkbM family methyltransferase
MNSISLKNIGNMARVLNKNTVVLYGAGGNGEKIYSFLKRNGIVVSFFIDDDFNKWGNKIDDISIVSFDYLCEIALKDTINVILTSVFSGPILKKLRSLNNVCVYEAFSILIEEFYNNSFYKRSLTLDEKDEKVKKISELQRLFNDDESIQILNKITDIISKQNEVDYRGFFSVASEEDCYFVGPIVEFLLTIKDGPIIVDCGGFTGDLMVGLEKHNIDYSKVYSFEANASLIEEMKRNIIKNSIVERFIPINKGVWDTVGEINFSVSPNEIAGGKLSESDDGIVVETTTIDTYFAKTPFDFIKMDIEGAELNALRGGRNSIIKYRPAMAISLYHSIDDVINIPTYLMQELKDYRFFIKHHSFIDSETVLYCIPERR